MAAQTTFLNNLLNAAFDGGTYTGGTIKMGLFTNKLPSAGGTEVTGGSYARATITFGSAASGSIATSPSAKFTNLPTGVTIGYYGIYNGTTLIDERALSSTFTTDISTNELDISYTFSLTAS